jgi:hypothetical protein
MSSISRSPSLEPREVPAGAYEFKEEERRSRKGASAPDIELRDVEELLKEKREALKKIHEVFENVAKLPIGRNMTLAANTHELTGLVCVS